MDDATSSDLYHIMTEQSATMDKLPEDSFRCINCMESSGGSRVVLGVPWNPSSEKNLPFKSTLNEFPDYCRL